MRNISLLETKVWNWDIYSSVSFCQTPYVKILKSNLLNKHLFLISRTSTPSPLWYFGWHIMLYRASLYFLLWPSLCKNESWSKKNRSFPNPFRYFEKKDSINTGRLLRTEYKSTNRSPYKSNFSTQLPSFHSKWSSTYFHSQLFNLR
jgi:hypothetical protein